ncbi:uncharacterized protein LOC115687766 [Syzygium oleosum]|uniref:uncharacterized protein LOC115687766 n=1 Tax=Syzygium oleosum TaxID=219896 RepID=UPI0011D18D45|nr:uncharacterized protein LOC115687766 [Syzygium oleosum]XP_030469294.1 uncharacterized protein LOC115687766 [Syzygium oleosum]
MGFEKVGEIKFLGITVSSRHKRSKSFPDKNRAPEDGSDVSPEVSQGMKEGIVYVEHSSKSNKKQSSNSETHNSLKQEILQLEKRLQDQFQVRHVLEKALGYQTSSHANASDVSMPKPATELIKEIATLELEVAHLEQYLLSLYRKAFDQQVSSVSPSTKDASSKDKRLRTPKDTPRARLFETPPSASAKRKEDSAVPSSGPLEIPLKDAHGLSEEEKLLHSGVHRCHSALSHRSALEVRICPREESLGKAVRACHSQPLSMIEFAQKAGTSVVSLAEYLGTTVSDHVPESANRLSEDMIKCVSSIYCKLADPPVANHGLSSPNSSLSSASEFSPQDQSDMWSPGFRNNSSFDVRLDNPFHVEGLKEFSGPYSTMVEVPWIHRDSQKLGHIEHLLQNYRSLICRLEEVDLRKLRHEEKLAFWINIHNALVMHAFLAYGIPQNNVKRVFQLLKAAYNVGGHTISADTIQSTILGCRMSRPGQWLRLLLSPKKKFKTGDERQAYGIKHAEPLLHFALCFGSHSDPAVRVYTPKGLFQELETAKEEYVRATFGVRKDKKILLPKTVESFAKESGLCTADIIEMVQKCLPDSLRKSLKKCPVGKSSKSIEWIPYNFSFRYLIAKELAK